MKVRPLICDINHYALSNEMEHYIDLYKADPYLIMSEATAKMLCIAFTIQ